MSAEQAVAATTTETAPTTETQAAETTGVENGDSTGAENGSPAETAAEAAYKANFKFRIPSGDAKQDVEKEFDEWIRPILTKKEIEDKVRDLYTKAHGIEYVQSARDRFKKDAETSTSELTSIRKSLATLSSYVQGDDLHSFFNTLRIPEEKVLKYALDRVNYHQLPPEKKAEYDRALDTRSRATLLAEENQRLQQENLQTQVMLRDQELGQVLKTPEISSIADTYDSRMGSPGAFRNECIKRGAYYFQTLKKDVPADVVAQEVAQEVSKLIGPQATTPVVATPGAPSPLEMQAPQAKKPVIPNIQGRGTSPAKKIPKSIADLKKLRQEA